MNDRTIQIGIDLGTTNSSVAINRNGTSIVIKKPGGVEYTPSVFGFDKANNKVVGQRAYEALYKSGDQENFCAEVKRIIGTTNTVKFARTKKELTPEEVSSEILIALKEEVVKQYPEVKTQAAVITVPAAFSTLQSEATKRAAELAGFKHVVLLQEPIAAAVAYGFGKSKSENWLIYDLNGGTFDVALISSQEGALSVLAHNGDNFLGGKNIDNMIVDEILVPRLKQDYEFANLSRENQVLKHLFIRLKYAAEQAKIELAQYEQTAIIVDTGEDDNGKEIYLSVDVSRKELEDLIKPIVDRTIRLSKKTLKDAGVKHTNVAKVVLVGGPTQIPYLRSRIQSELQIDTDWSVDPLTVVAQGASLYGLSQLIPEELIAENADVSTKEARHVSLHYEPLTSDTEATISGVFEDLEDSSDDYYVQIQSDSGAYSGERLRLKNGKFFDSIVLEEGRPNLFWIYLFDTQGNSLPVSPESFTITHGLSVTGAPLPHAVGVVISEDQIGQRNTAPRNVRDILFEKGAPLPLTTSKTYKTAWLLKKGDQDTKLPIIIDEGESDNPENNTYVCQLLLRGDELPHDLPLGTEVRLDIQISESRTLQLNVYIPLIDKTLMQSRTLAAEEIDVASLEVTLSAQRERAATLRDICSSDEREQLDYMIESATKSVTNAHLDEDEKRKAGSELRGLKEHLDQLDKEKEWPQLKQEFRSGVSSVRQLISEFGDSQEANIHNEQINGYEHEGNAAIERDDKEALIHTNEQIKELGARVLFSNPAAWVYQFRKITEGNPTFINEKEARYYIDKGNRAIDVGDVDELKRCVHNLVLLLPPEKQADVQNELSGLTK